MIIKIDGERYINTEQITVIEPGFDPSDGVSPAPGMFCIHFTGFNQQLIVPSTTVNYILEAIDANTSYTDALTETEIPSRPLTSRIASLLRNHLNGLTFSELMTLLGLDKDTDEDALGLALEALVKDNTIRGQGINNSWRWFHNSTPGALNQW